MDSFSKKKKKKILNSSNPIIINILIKYYLQKKKKKKKKNTEKHPAFILDLYQSLTKKQSSNKLYNYDTLYLLYQYFYQLKQYKKSQNLLYRLIKVANQSIKPLVTRKDKFFHLYQQLILNKKILNFLIFKKKFLKKKKNFKKKKKKKFSSFI